MRLLLGCAVLSTLLDEHHRVTARLVPRLSRRRRAALEKFRGKRMGTKIYIAHRIVRRERLASRRSLAQVHGPTEISLHHDSISSTFIYHEIMQRCDRH